MMLLAMLLAAAAPDCSKAVTQADMDQCAGGQAKRADAALNAAWTRLYGHAGGSKPAFLAAQRQWLRFRDAECTAEAGMYEGGSMQPMVHAQCIAGLTAERTRHLQALAQDAER